MNDEQRRKRRAWDDRERARLTEQAKAERSSLADIAYTAYLRHVAMEDGPLEQQMPEGLDQQRPEGLEQERDYDREC